MQKKNIDLSILCVPFFILNTFSQSRTIADIPAPEGYTLVPTAPYSYSRWIVNLPLRTGNEIRMYTGDTLFNTLYRVYAVIDLPLLFAQDLEQCADWAFRFWAEYHRQRGMLEKLYLMDYNGRRRPFGRSNQSFKQFFKWTAAHANSYSIKAGAKTIHGGELQPGDMVVQNEKGGIGYGKRGTVSNIIL